MLHVLLEVVVKMRGRFRAGLFASFFIFSSAINAILVLLLRGKPRETSQSHSTTDVAFFFFLLLKEAHKVSVEWAIKRCYIAARLTRQ